MAKQSNAAVKNAPVAAPVKAATQKGFTTAGKTNAEQALDLEALLLSPEAETIVIRQGRGESDVADAEDFPESPFAGMDYDSFCTKLRTLNPNEAILLREARDFSGNLQSFAVRIKNAIENREKRGVLALTKKEVKLEQLKAGSDMTVTKEDGSKQVIKMPFNAVRIRSLIGVDG